MNLSHGFSFDDLYKRESLERLDQIFLDYLSGADEGLAICLEEARKTNLAPLAESNLLLDLAPYVEDFLSQFFSVQKEIVSLQEETYALAPLYRCKRLFIQRQVAKSYSKEEAFGFDGTQLKKELEEFMGEPFTELIFARCVLKALGEDNRDLFDTSSLSSPRRRGSNVSQKTCHPESLGSDLIRDRSKSSHYCHPELVSGSPNHLKEMLKQVQHDKLGDERDTSKTSDLVSKNKNFLETAKKYAAWALHQENPSLLFKLPKKIDKNNLIALHRKGNTLKSTQHTPRHGFDCTDPGVKVEEALDQAHYCIVCHPQNKDSCSKGLSEDAKGCPLDQKISEMNTLRAQGYVLGALAMIMVDNPMVAATGHRICNDCMKACIFQKQEPVNVPTIETQTLETILNLPWGVEIYSLLSRWNPLNLKTSYPKKDSGYKILVAGMGPAGFTLAHYLLNEGHTVVAIDGLKIEPLDLKLLAQPIYDWKSLKEPLSQRKTIGFGGVTEYGITVRWEKNYLTLIRLLLERRSQFVLFDSIRIGSNLTLPQAFKLGFDHVALCLGAGKPNVLEIKHGLSKGIKLASDFLMTLQLNGAAQEDSLANLQIRLPILVIGGGLTAVDTATEALAYYPIQVEKFLKRTEALEGLPPSLSEEEKLIAKEFLDHAQALRKGDRSFLKNACQIVYRKSLQESPSYRLNHEELDLALNQGVGFRENATPHEIKVDQFGHMESLVVETNDGLQTLPCRTLLIATGTQPNKILEKEDPELKLESNDFLINYQGNDKVSFFGDLHPDYSGNVVKAMASAKKGYPLISKTLLNQLPSSNPKFFEKLKASLRSQVHKINRLTVNIVEVILKSPQATQNFKPGQFFRLQNYGFPSMEGLALTGAHSNTQKGLLSLIILEMGGSSTLCQFLKEGDPVSLMGPTGSPTEIPMGKTVLLIGGGLGNAVLFSIAQALKENNNRVLYVAGYKTPSDRFKAKEIEDFADHVIWCSESSQGFVPSRSKDFAYIGNVIEGLVEYAQESSPLPLSEVTHILTIGSDQMMAAVACARKTILKHYLNPNHVAMGSINSPMQCMMKEICGQCIQTQRDPKTGKTHVVFSCTNQDQDLDKVDFDVLHGRLKQNSLLEKQTYLWVEKYINGK